MPDQPADRIWDENDWERFLRQQEQRTEKYVELLEKYLDHPQRDEIIAREMGWTHLLNGETRDWEEAVDAQFEKGLAEGEPGSGEASGSNSLFGAEKHPLYQQAIAATAELDEIFNRTPERTQEHPATITLHSQTTLAAAKLAAALNDDNVNDLGMSIAYLRRALHALTNGLNAVMQLHEGVLLEAGDFERIRRRLFAIRDGVVSTMGEYRAEFRRRHGR